MRTFSRRLVTILLMSPPGRSVRPIEPANSTSPLKHSGAPSLDASSPSVRNSTDPLVWPGAWLIGHRQPGDLQHLTVGDLHDVLRFGVGHPAAEQLIKAHRQTLGRVGEHLKIVRVDVGGDAPRTAHRSHRESVVEVAVGEQHRGRGQPVFLEHRLELVDDADARIDHQARLARIGRDQVAIRPEGVSGEAGDQHEQSFLRR